MLYPSLSFRSVFDADARAFIARLTGSYTLSQRKAINDFFVGLKSDNLYNLFDVFHLICLANSADSRLNILSTSHTCDAFTTGFTAWSGVTGINNTKSGYIPASHAVNLTESSNHIGIYLATYGSSRCAVVDASVNSSLRFKVECRTPSAPREITNLNSSDSAVPGLTSEQYPGTYINTRNGNVISALAGNVQYSVNRATESTLPSYTSQLRLSPGLQGHRVTALFAGGVITSAQSQQLEDRLKTLFTALGVSYT